jgi:cytochrome c oxidase subunit 2
VFLLLAVFLVRYRHRPGRRAVYCHGNPKLEAVWTAVPAIVLVLLAAFSQKSWSYIKTPRPIPTAAEVLSGEKIGLDRDHPAARDDFCTDTMFIPMDKDVIFRLMSIDGLHSFWVLDFYFKQDAVPGLSKQLWLRATRTSAEIVGTYAGGRPKPFDFVCAESYGQGHYTMRGMLFAVTQKQCQAWYDQQVAYRQDELLDS